MEVLTQRVYQYTVYTHLIGSPLALVTGGILIYQVSNNSWSNPSIGDRLSFGIYLTATSICFGFSAMFHTLRSHSYHVHHLWGRMDILGINVLALGGGISANYYAFYCQPTIQKTYWGLVGYSKSEVHQSVN